MDLLIIVGKVSDLKSFSYFVADQLDKISDKGACYSNYKSPNLSCKKPEIHHRMLFGITNCPCNSSSSREYYAVRIITSIKLHGKINTANPPDLQASQRLYQQLNSSLLFGAGVEKQSILCAVKTAGFLCV